MQVKFQPINLYHRREMCPLQDLDSGQNDQLERVLFRKVKSESSTNAREMFPVGPRFLRLAPSRNTSNPPARRTATQRPSLGLGFRPIMAFSSDEWCLVSTPVVCGLLLLRAARGRLGDAWGTTRMEGGGVKAGCAHARR